MLQLENASFTFSGEDTSIPPPVNRYPVTVHMVPIGPADYSVRCYCRNALIGSGRLQGDPSRWMAEVFAMRFLMEPMKFTEEANSNLSDFDG